MIKLSSLFVAFFSLAILCGCSSTPLPLGTPTKYKTYSNAVIVGGVVRDRMTGHYTVARSGWPIPVTDYNDVHEPLSQTVEEDQLAALIALRAGRIARREEILEEMKQVVADRAPKGTTLNPDRAQYLYAGQEHGIPPQ